MRACENCAFDKKKINAICFDTIISSITKKKAIINASSGLVKTFLNLVFSVSANLINENFLFFT